MLVLAVWSREYRLASTPACVPIAVESLPTRHSAVLPVPYAPTLSFPLFLDLIHLEVDHAHDGGYEDRLEGRGRGRMRAAC